MRDGKDAASILTSVQSRSNRRQVKCIWFSWVIKKTVLGATIDKVNEAEVKVYFRCSNKMLREIDVEVERLIHFRAAIWVASTLCERHNHLVHATSISQRVMTEYSQEQTTFDQPHMNIKDRDALISFLNLVWEIKRPVDKSFGREALGFELSINRSESGLVIRSEGNSYVAAYRWVKRGLTILVLISEPLLILKPASNPYEGGQPERCHVIKKPGPLSGPLYLRERRVL
jgi:hypothetical protein